MSERLAVLTEAANAQCVFCGGRAATIWDGKIHPYGEGDVMQLPLHLPKQYVSNCGVMAGWVHHLSWGGYVDCEAKPIRDLIAAERLGWVNE